MNDPKSTQGWRFYGAAALLSLVYAVTIYWSALTTNGYRGPGVNDLQTQFGPYFAATLRAVREGQLPPGWLDGILGGMPVAGNAAMMCFYPPKYLLLLWPETLLATAMTALIVVHYVIAGMGAYALARSLGVARSWALLAVPAYIGNGWLIGHDTHLATLFGAAWMPWALTALRRAALSPHWYRWSALLALAIAMQLLSAGYQLVMYTGLAGIVILVGYAVAEHDRVKVLRTCLAGMLGALTGLAMGAAQLVPSLVTADWSARGSDQGVQGFAEIGSRELAHFPMFFANDALAADVTSALAFPVNELQGQLSVALLVLLCFFAAARADRRTLALVISAAFFVVLSLGPGTPVESAVAAVIPGWDAFRYPARAGLMATLAMTLAALVTVGGASIPRSSQPWFLPWAAGLLCIGLLVVSVRGGGVSTMATVAGIGGGALFAGIVALQFKRESWLPAMIGVLMLAESLLNYAPIERERVVETGNFQQGEEITTYLRENAGSGRAFTVANMRTGWGPIFNAGLTDGWSNLNGYDPQLPWRLRDYMKATQGGGTDPGIHVLLTGDPGAELLRRFGVRYVVLPEFVDWRQVRGMQAANVVAASRRHYVVDLGESRPLVRAIGEWTVHTEDSMPPLEEQPTTDFLALPFPSNAACAQPLQLANVDWSNARTAFSASGPCAGMVVIARNHHPGWTATVNGAPVPLVVANHAMMAIPVPAGTSSVELRFDDASVDLGVGTSAGGLALAAVLLLLGRSRQRNVPRSSLAA